jgi:hypothetical protein
MLGRFPDMKSRRRSRPFCRGLEALLPRRFERIEIVTVSFPFPEIARSNYTHRKAFLE